MSIGQAIAVGCAIVIGAVGLMNHNGDISPQVSTVLTTILGLGAGAALSVDLLLKRRSSS